MSFNFNEFNENEKLMSDEKKETPKFFVNELS